VVLAFDNLSNDSEMQFFSDGVSEEIIQRLSQGTNLKVIGRSTSFQFRGERKAEVAEKLGCSHVLDGSIRRAANKVRINANLEKAADKTTLWSERYDRELQDILLVQEDISRSIATALKHTFSGRAPDAIDPDDYDLYLRASPNTFAPDELRGGVNMLEVVTKRAPKFAAAWGRLAFIRSFLHFYQPYSERGAAKALIEQEAKKALATDPDNLDALVAQLFALPPFGEFPEGGRRLERLRNSPGRGDGKKYVGWYMRTLGMVEESVMAAQAAYELDPLHAMTINQLALAKLAAGHLDKAAPLYENLVESNPGMSFPVSSLLRVYAFQETWTGVDHLIALAEKRSLREFSEGLPFIRAKRNPTRDNIGAIGSALQRCAEAGAVDVSRLVYAAHLGLVDQAYAAAAVSRLGPGRAADDIMGPDAYRTSLLFQANMPELRNDKRFPELCARLGLVGYWVETQNWPDCWNEVPYDFKAACENARGIPRESCSY
jgi:TolB-like protein